MWSFVSIEVFCEVLAEAHVIYGLKTEIHPTHRTYFSANSSCNHVSICVSVSREHKIQAAAAKDAESWRLQGEETSQTSQEGP